MKLISVIIPYYKKKKFIKKTIISVLNQTYKNFEIIIIYDDTEKKELSFIKKLSKLDKRIRLIINNNNLGAGLSRNIGIEKAKGYYICFLDADDVWDKKKIKLQLDYMEKNKISISHTSYYVYENKKMMSKRIAKNFLNLNSLLYSCDIGCSTVMIKKKVLYKKNNFPSLKTKEDFVLWLKLLKKGYKIYGIKNYLSIWQKTPKSLSSNVFQKLADGYKVYNYYIGLNKLKSLFFLFVLSINFLIKKN